MWVARIQGLDYAIYQAQQSGVRLLVSLVNNWEDYGGKAKYVAWDKAPEGENAENEDDFFTNHKCRHDSTTKIMSRFAFRTSNDSCNANLVFLILI